MYLLNVYLNSLVLNGSSKLSRARNIFGKFCAAIKEMLHSKLLMFYVYADLSWCADIADADFAINI